VPGLEATRAIRQAEVGAARTMLERTEDRFGLKPDYLTGDSAYGSAESLAWLVKQKKITPHIPVFDKSTRTDGTFSRADFTFDPERDRYTCPAGKELVQFRRTYAIPRTGITAEGTRLYRASKRDCDVCDLKSRSRKIPRDLNENARDVARALASTPEYEAACRRRKKVEMLFAWNGMDAVKINNFPYKIPRSASDRKIHWPAGRRPADHAGLKGLSTSARTFVQPPPNSSASTALNGKFAGSSS
jgi:hypothetical protein